jgi:hypothetical protein
VHRLLPVFAYESLFVCADLLGGEVNCFGSEVPRCESFAGFLFRVICGGIRRGSTHRAMFLNPSYLDIESADDLGEIRRAAEVAACLKMHIKFISPDV